MRPERPPATSTRRVVGPQGAAWYNRCWYGASHAPHAGLRGKSLPTSGRGDRSGHLLRVSRDWQYLPWLPSTRPSGSRSPGPVLPQRSTWRLPHLSGPVAGTDAGKHRLAPWPPRGPIAVSPSPGSLAGGHGHHRRDRDSGRAWRPGAGRAPCELRRVVRPGCRHGPVGDADDATVGDTPAADRDAATRVVGVRVADARDVDDGAPAVRDNRPRRHALHRSRRPG